VHATASVTIPIQQMMVSAVRCNGTEGREEEEKPRCHQSGVMDIYLERIEMAIESLGSNWERLLITRDWQFKWKLLREHASKMPNGSFMGVAGFNEWYNGEGK
jgi:hypothetical protein